MKIVIDPAVLRNAQVSNGYGRTLSHVLNKAPYYSHVYTEELRAAYARAGPTGQGTPQLLAAQLAKQLCLASNVGATIHRQIITPFLSAEEACGGGIDCRLTESDKQLVRVAKSIVWESTPDLETPKIIILVDCAADSCERCICQEVWVDQLINEVRGTIICRASDPLSLESLLQKDITLLNQQHQARFELVCARWLDHKHVCHGSVNYKYSKMVNGKTSDFEQDYFCDVRVNNLRHLYIGESKLFDGEHKAPELIVGIKQLKRAVRDLARDEPLPDSVDCFLFSNSPSVIDQSVKRNAQLLASTHGVTVHLYRVIMPDRWKSQPNWLPQDGHFEEVCVFPPRAGN